MRSNDTFRFFVYGSLLTDFYNFNKFLRGKTIHIESGYIYGKLFHLQNKGYPAFIEGGKDKVYGEIITFENSQETLKAIDRLEKFDPKTLDENEYNRKIQLVYSEKTGTISQMYVYVYNWRAKQNENDVKIYLPSGNWRKYMEEK